MAKRSPTEPGRASKLGADPLAARKGLSWLVPRSEQPAAETPAQQTLPSSTSEPVMGDAAPALRRPERARGKKAKNASHQGLAEGYKRHTFILPEKLVQGIKAVAFYQDRPVKEIVEEALQRYLDTPRDDAS